MKQLKISVLKPMYLDIDVDPKSVVVKPDRFLAVTMNGGTVSISRSAQLEHPIIESVDTCGDGSRPPAIVGEVPEEIYDQLLRHALGIGRKDKVKDTSPKASSDCA